MELYAERVDYGDQGTKSFEEIRRLLFDPDKKGVRAALRRRPADLIGWPEVNRIIHFVELDGKAKHLEFQRLRLHHDQQVPEWE